MIKKLIWLILLGTIFIFVLPKVFYQLSLLFDPTNADIQRVIYDEDSEFLLSPEFDTLPTATNSAKLHVHGFSQNATEVELYINDIAKEKIPITKEDGSFRIRNVRLFEGANVMTLIAYDRAGNKSAYSDEVTVEYKRGAPKLAIQEPDENGKMTGSDRKVTIIGITDTDSSITINGRWIRVASDGTFSSEVNLSDGENEFKIVASDEAGNETSITRTVMYANE